MGALAVLRLHQHVSAHQISNCKQNHLFKLIKKTCHIVSYVKHLNKDFLNPVLLDALTGHKVKQNHLKTKKDDTFMDS